MANENYWATKTVTPTSVPAGDICTYTLTLNNSSLNPIAAVYLYDSLPAGLHLLPGSVTVKGDMMDNATLDGKACVGGLNPEGTLVVTYQAYATQDVTADKTLSTHACFYDGNGNNLACTNASTAPPSTAVPPIITLPVLPSLPGDGDDDDEDDDDAAPGVTITIGHISIGTVNITCCCGGATSATPLLGCEDGECDENDDSAGLATVNPLPIQPL
jgi:uncharacterized repeat protein (TIGR01451 family)